MELFGKSTSFYEIIAGIISLISGGVTVASKCELPHPNIVEDMASHKDITK